MHFAAIGNEALLSAPEILQIQCSRRYFAYGRDAKGNVVHDRPDACVLNRIAQLIAGKGAVEVDYKGARLEGVEPLVAELTRGEEAG